MAHLTAYEERLDSIPGIKSQREYWRNRARATELIPQQPIHATHKERCKKCGLKIRGTNHAAGDDHIHNSK